MQKTLAIYDTTLGKKAIMALSGLVMFGFVIGHMLGNLQVYLGPEQLNAYAAGLRDVPALLWAVRLTLLLAITVHVAMAIQLTARSRAARRQGYRVKRNVVTNYAATTMLLSGPMILFFVLYHLAHFTYPGVAMSGYEHSGHDVYANVINGFSVPWVAALYVLAQVFLGLHLYHGAKSLLQTLGINNPLRNRPIYRLARSVALVVVLGNVTIPLAVVFGLVGR